MSNRKIACLLALLAVLACLAGGCRESEGSRYARAKNLLAEGKYAEAAGSMG